MINDLTPHFTAAYQTISSKKSVGVTYKSSIENPTDNKTTNKELILRKIDEVSYQERERGISLVGPHRDDLILNLGEHPVKGYASHGESWSVALSLRLASYQLLVSDGDSPILILDDVFSELDEARREKLAQVANQAEQTLITVAVENDLPKKINGSRYRVVNGEVKTL